jgi:psiF repeat
MRLMIPALAFTLTVMAAPSFAASHAGAAPMADKKPTAQQTKMGECNKEAGEKKLAGDERKKFMSSCLSAKKVSQQDRMKSCNKEAGDKKLAGEERKKFMSSCLSA